MGTVHKFTPDGKPVTHFETVSSSAGDTMGWLRSITIDGQDRLYVNDPTNIRVFDSNGTYLDGMSDVFADGVREMRIANGSDLFVLGFGHHYSQTGNWEVYKMTWNQP